MEQDLEKETVMAQEKGLEQYGEVAEGILINVAQETGTSDRGDWVLYRLILDSGQEYSQFASNKGLPPNDTSLEKVQGYYATAKEKGEYLKIKLAYTTKGQYKNITAITNTGRVNKEDLPKEVLDLDKYMKPKHPQDVVAMTYISSYERAITFFTSHYPTSVDGGKARTRRNDGSIPLMACMNEIDEVAEHIANTVLIRSGYREKDTTEGTKTQD